jgi:hypothetical protein
VCAEPLSLDGAFLQKLTILKYVGMSKKERKKIKGSKVFAARPVFSTIKSHPSRGG